MIADMLASKLAFDSLNTCDAYVVMANVPLNTVIVSRHSAIPIAFNEFRLTESKIQKLWMSIDLKNGSEISELTDKFKIILFLLLLPFVDDNL